jgi:DNA repair protein RadC
MRITTYKAKLNEDRIVMLVKEAAINYTGAKNIDSQEICAKMLDNVFDASNLPEEHMFLVALNGARKVAGVFDVSHGTLMSSMVHPREIFSRAILAGAATIIIAHNHPSGELNISEQDRKVTDIIKQAGELMGIRLDDHLIIANGRFASAMHDSCPMFINR